MRDLATILLLINVLLRCCDSVTDANEPSLSQLVREVDSFEVLAPVTEIAFSENSQLLACGALNGQVFIRQLTTTKSVVTIEAHKECVSKVSFSPNGQIFSSVDANGEFCVWKLNELGQAIQLSKHQRGISWAVYETSESLVLGGMMGNIFRWTTDDPHSLTKYFVFPGKYGIVATPILLDDEQSLLIPDFNKVLSFDIANNKTNWTIPISKYGIRSMCKFHDETQLLTVDVNQSGTVTSFANKQSRSIGNLESLGVGVSPRDKFGIFLGCSDIGGDCWIAIRSLETGEKVLTFKVPTSNAIGVSADGRLLAVGGETAKQTKRPTILKVYDMLLLWDQLEK